jgi:NAD(P)-dependent dehydrogenase (short-subunit alcohol dehydrogenase family)
MAGEEYPRFDLSGQVAIVTGASKGIGWGLAKALAHAGARVAVAARDEDALQTLAGEIRAEGGEALAVPLDVTDVQ